MRRTTISDPRQGRKSAGSLLAVAALVGCGAATVATTVPKPAPHKTRAPEVHGSKLAVATENGDASRIAMDVLRAGGDAVDAAAAAALSLGVATPTACGVGGGGFAVVWRAKTKEAFVLDFRETAPAKVDVAALDRRPLPPEERGHYVGVPGEVAGLSQLVAKFGKKSFREDVLPAAALAKNGFALTAHVARGVTFREKDLRTLAPSLGVRLLGEGGPLPVGTKVVRPDLAETLQKIADGGPKAFYEGPIADAMVAATSAAGGTLTHADLTAYAPKVRSALRIAYGKREVITMPTPSAGGVMLAEALRSQEILAKKDGKGLAAASMESPATLHTLAEIMRGALDDRARFLGDPDATPVDLNALVAEARIAKRVAMFDPMKTHPAAELAVDEHGTSHLCILDAEGNAVALTTTVNGPFGARIVAGATGVLMNDEMDDFGKTADAIGKKPNVPRPGARPTSSMTPTIVVEDGRVVMIAGGSGGMRIATSVTLASVANLVFGMSPGDAVGLPRIHVQGPKLLLEPSFDAAVIKDLESRGEQVSTAEAINAVQMIAVGSDIAAASDPRKGGVALAE